MRLEHMGANTGKIKGGVNLGLSQINSPIDQYFRLVQVVSLKYIEFAKLEHIGAQIEKREGGVNLGPSQFNSPIDQSFILFQVFTPI